jgi:hypothetical protein
VTDAASEMIATMKRAMPNNPRTLATRLG